MGEPMTTSSEVRWERLEQDLLAALGCTALEGRVARPAYRLLVVPTFYPPCCFQFLFGAPEASFRFAMLPGVTNPVSDFILNAQGSNEIAAIEEAMFSSLDATRSLDAEAERAYLGRFAALPAPTAAAGDLAARDGVAIRLDWRGVDAPTALLRAQLASVSASPELAAWLTVFFDGAATHTTDWRLKNQLRRVRSCFFAEG